MDSTQIELVQSSFSKVAPISEQAAEIFYGKLFEKDPALKPLFKGDMKEQGRKLMSMLATAVNGLNNLEALVPAVEDLAVRHVGYGVTSAMYETVGSALIDTLEVGLGDDFTPEVKAAWVETYTILSSTMIAAAEKATPPAEEEGPISMEEIKIVQSTFQKVGGDPMAVAELFYQNLFEIDPSVKPLFPEDLTEQRKKLMTMLAAAVNGLNDLGSIVGAVQDLGKRHVNYKVTPEMYDSVGAALLKTLGMGLGDDFTPEAEAAWTKVYGILADTMKAAAAEVEVSEEPAEEGPVTAKEVELVQASFAKVAPIAEQAAEIFYGKLFEKDPSLKPLFKGDMKEQGKKLMAMIATAVNGLTDLGAIVPAVQDLGKRHAGYGVSDEMYDTVGAALLETLEAGLGDDFTPDVKSAWVSVYTVLATTMKDAAATVPQTTETASTSKWWQFWK